MHISALASGHSTEIATGYAILFGTGYKKALAVEYITGIGPSDNA